MTETEQYESQKNWLELYTWIQEDGSIDFHKPRERPIGLEVDPREWTFDA